MELQWAGFKFIFTFHPVCQLGCFSLNEIRDGWRVMSVWTGLIISNLELSITRLSPGSLQLSTFLKQYPPPPPPQLTLKKKYLARNQEPQIFEFDGVMVWRGTNKWSDNWWIKYVNVFACLELMEEIDFTIFGQRTKNYQWAWCEPSPGEILAGNMWGLIGCVGLPKYLVWEMIIFTRTGVSV